MDPITAKLMSAAAGAAADRVYVDDVFSTFLYDGNNTGQTITNGIDLSGEGGMVWIKGRNNGTDSMVWDTERGARKYVATNSTSSESTSGSTSGLTGFNSNGFTLGSNWNTENFSSYDYVSWSFRKAPGFFDIVTWTGNGTGQTISHNLGSVPGSIWVKQLNFNRDWWCYHRGTDATNPSHYILNLNKADARTDDSAFNDTEPTSTSFTLSSAGEVNGNGDTYVAYIFAHDDQSFGDAGNESIIKCGSYTGTGAAGNQITLGFEPQWLMVKNTSRGAQDWEMFDNMRGVATGGIASELFPNTNGAERSAFNIFNFNATGFETESTLDQTNANGDNYIYIAIRRPHKTPEDAADVFQPDLKSSNQTITTDFPVDLCVAHYTGGGAPYWVDRMRGIFTGGTNQTQKYLNSSSTAAQGNDNGTLGVKDFDSTSYEHSLGNFEQSTLAFKRAKGFFDIVTYTGTTNTSNNVAHNLGVVPSMMIFKKTNGSGEWAVRTVGSGDLDRTGFQLNRNYAITNTGFGTAGLTATTFNPYYISTSDGSNSTYPDNALNSSGDSYVAYLFGNLEGVSKVGAYSGTGNNINVDCGFTAGARFVMIKRTDSTGDWYYWQTALGINSGNDPYLRMNSNGSKVTNTDYIDPLNAGFTVTSSAPAALNASGGKYIFLAIA